MRAVVTGAAGFIGATLCEQLLGDGWSVTGVDSFTTFYDPSVKRRNAARWAGHAHAEVVEVDLLDGDVRPLLSGADAAFHLAGQPGVRGSWEDGFDLHCSRNILATQRVLDAVVAAAPQVRLVVASSSSVYGNQPDGPVAEDARLHPFSPYGVSKLSCEHLCRAYADNFEVSSVLLRYFTVFGPHQRPDMAMHRLIAAALHGTTFPLFGDGTQRRDFTYVADAVAATVAAGTADVAPATPVNVCGGEVVTMNAVIDLVGELVGDAVRIDHTATQAGDVTQTWGDSTAAERLLGCVAEVGVRDGLARQVAWMRSQTDG